jgi:type IV pilus assembly protein PilQ
MISTYIAQYSHNHSGSPERHGPGTIIRRISLMLVLIGASVVSGHVRSQESAASNSLESFEVGSLPGNQVQIVFNLSQPAEKPLTFTIDNPARIALDLPATSNKLEKRSQSVGVGLVKSLTAIEAQGRTRVVMNLTEMAPYDTRVEDNKIIVTLQDPSATIAAAAAKVSEKPLAAGKQEVTQGAALSVTGVDFRRGEQGEGRVVITLSDPSVPVDLHQEAGKVVVDLFGATLPQKLERRLDVLDFATPIRTVDAFNKGNNARLVIDPFGEYDFLGYQTDNQFTVEVKTTTKEEQEVRKREQIGFTGERLSLNFQDIEVRSVLQLIADFTGINIVVSDTVTGNLTLRLQNVPWDQALDIILKTKGLAMRQTDDVMLVAPGDEIAAREKLELESLKQIEELSPLYSEFIQINYAKASDLADLIKNEDTSLLSERGTVTIDERTNTLLVQDTAEKLQDIRALVARLDIPVRQVLIESRIVIAQDNFAKDLGVRLGLTARGTADNGDRFRIVGGGLPGDLATPSPIIVNPGDSDPPVEALTVDLPVQNAAGAVNFLVGKIGQNLLRLELSALQLEGRGEVVSSPRVVTSNQQEAMIRQGVEVPYQEASSSGATSVSFKEAVLSLRVTPQITPDDRIIMDLKVNKDNVGEVFQGVPSIDTRAVETQVLVDNGETVVLGGIYETTQSKEKDAVPFFSDIPGLGWAFRQTRDVNDRSELLIFVTPRIIKQTLAVR